MILSLANPHSKASGHYSIYLILALAVLLVLSAAAIVGLQRYSHKQFEAAIRTNELGLATYHYYASARRETLAHVPQANIPAEVSRQEQLDAAEFFNAAAARYYAKAAQGFTSSVSETLTGLVNEIERARELRLQGNAQAALLVMSFEANPYYYGTVDAVFAASESYATKATRAANVAQGATIGIYVLTFLLGTALYTLFRRAQRNAERGDAEREILERSEARFRPLVESSSDVIAVVDAEGSIQFASPAIQRLAGISPEDAVGLPVLDFVAPADRITLANFLAQVKDRPGYTATAELLLHSRRPPHDVFFVQMVCTNRLNDPDVNGLVLNIRDISARKELEEQLRHQAFHDSLTGLANRLRFMDRLDHALQVARRHGQQKVSVLYMDLDYLKNINDELGHAAGDLVLQETARRILACIRSSDTAARLGGDEFAVLLEDYGGVNNGRNTADRILEQVLKPFTVADREVSLGVSIGVVVADSGTMTAEDVIRDADVAMYDAKENGRSRVQVFEPGMQLSFADRLSLTSELNASIDRDELVVYYQPTLYLEDERIAGFEALVRWQHPTRGLLLPAEFIELAEETGFIHKLGRFVLLQACRQAQEWRAQYPELTGVTMSVNVSARQLQQAGFVEIVEQVLLESGFDPACLILEITESVFIKQSQTVVVALEHLKTLGVKIALDDFGTGYSSLSYLKRFPIDVLKIDHSFIEGMDVTDRDLLLVQTVIDLGRMLGLEIVAEGIERREQLKSLKDLHCDLGQGFLFAKASDARIAGELLRNQVLTRPLPAAHPEDSDDTAEQPRSVA